MADQTRQRLRELVSLLIQHTEGLTTTEIGERLNVSRQTALKDINRLSTDGYPIYQDGTRYYIDPGYGKTIHLSLAQAWLMYLLLRRMVRAALHRDELVRSMLYEIAQLLQADVADQLLAVPQVQADETGTIGRHLSTLVECWNKRQLAQVHYQRPNAASSSQLTIAPWWFEPAPWTDGFYCLCGLSGRDGTFTPTTLRLDRIHHAKPLPEPFELPDTSALLRYVEQAWGIWMGEPTQVRLRFANHQYQRLLETRWHKDQTITLQPDGSAIWEAPIAEPQEMLPWIRGWGADVEVLEPTDLRERIASEAEATVRLYGRGGGQQRRYF